MTKTEARECIRWAKEHVKAAQSTMHQTLEFQNVTAALSALNAARYDYCLVYHTAKPGDGK